MKTEKPTNRAISRDIRACITIDLPDGEIEDLIETADDLCGLSYDAGYNLGMVDGAWEYEIDNPPVNVEKVNSEYVTAQFADCKTLEQFQDVYNEIRNLSYTYM